MPSNTKPDAAKTQIDKFREAARQLETDDDEARFDERLKRIAKNDVTSPKRNDPKRNGNKRQKDQ